MKTEKSERHKPANRERKDPRNWNFNDVPKEQRGICCFWEYARESASIRKAVEIAKTAFANEGKWEAFRDKKNEAYALLHLTGYPLEFYQQLPFPAPWLSVDVDQRTKCALVRREMPVPVKIPPFKVTGDSFIVGYLSSLAREADEKRNAAWAQVVEAEKQKQAAVAKAVRGEGADVAELHKLDRRIAELVKQAKQHENPSPISFLGGGGVQSFVGQINWRDYTKPEIKNAIWKWIETNRPPTIPDPSGRGHDPMEECRASLERLALLRLRSRYTIDETLAMIAKILPLKQRLAASKFTDSSECNREAGKAVTDFHELLHFLDPTEMPRSWPLK
jgi:hypothetical protein